MLDDSHTLSIRLKWSMPRAKPHTVSVRWCLPSSTRDMPTRKAHSTKRMRSGTARTRWDSRNLETMAARLACAAGKEYTSMAMLSRRPGIISQGPRRFISLWTPATVMMSRRRAVTERGVKVDYEGEEFVLMRYKSIKLIKTNTIYHILCTIFYCLAEFHVIKVILVIVLCCAFSLLMTLQRQKMK